jgi:accessory gene regulator B
MEILADRIASFLILQGKATEKDRDIYIYGIIVTFSVIVNAFITLVVGFVFHIPLQVLAYIIPFMMLRMSCGGYHAKSFCGCIAMSSFTQFMIVFSIVYMPKNLEVFATIGLFIFTGTIIFLFAPVEHKNRPLDHDERKRFRRRSRIIAIGIMGLDMIFVILQIEIYSFCIALGLVTAALALLLEVVMKRGEKVENA